MQTNVRNNNTIVYILALVAVTVIALAAIMYYSDARRPATVGERIEAAADEMAEGVDNATERMQDRTPAEKVGDAIEDAGDRVQDSMSR
jgi:hypothetical protein